MNHQYVTVELKYVSGKTGELAWTERLNAVSAEGWRLVTINSVPFKGGSSHYATFERETPNE